MGVPCARVRVCCPSCGQKRYLTERAARDNGGQSLCPICKIMKFHSSEPVTDQHRRFWLSNYSDSEIAQLASDLLDEPVPESRVRWRWPRERLLANGRGLRNLENARTGRL